VPDIFFQNFSASTETCHSAKQWIKGQRSLLATHLGDEFGAVGGDPVSCHAHVLCVRMRKLGKWHSTWQWLSTWTCYSGDIFKLNVDKSLRKILFYRILPIIKISNFLCCGFYFVSPCAGLDIVAYCFFIVVYTMQLCCCIKRCVMSLLCVYIITCGICIHCPLLLDSNAPPSCDVMNACCVVCTKYCLLVDEKLTLTEYARCYLFDVVYLFRHFWCFNIDK